MCRMMSYRSIAGKVIESSMYSHISLDLARSPQPRYLEVQGRHTRKFVQLEVMALSFY